MGWSFFNREAKAKLEFEKRQAELEEQYNNIPIEKPVQSIINALRNRPYSFSIEETAQIHREDSNVFSAESHKIITDRKTGVVFRLYENRVKTSGHFIIKTEDGIFNTTNIGNLYKNVTHKIVTTEFALSNYEKFYLSQALGEFIRYKTNTTQSKWQARKRKKYIELYSELGE